MIKLFASDLDGTLIENNKISDKNLKAIKELQDHGIIFAFVTGRIHHSASYIAKKHGLKIPIIGSNGAVVLDSEGRVINYRKMPWDDLEEAIKLLDERDLYYHFYDGDTFYSKVYSQERLDHLLLQDGRYKKFQMDLCISEKAFKRAKERGLGVTKVVVTGEDDEKIDRIYRDLSALPSIKLTLSNKNYIEFMARGVNKFSGIEFLLDKYGFEKSELAAIGDYNNDYEMVSEAGFGACVQGASEELKKVADYISGPYNEDGFAQAVEYMLKEFKIC